MAQDSTSSHTEELADGADRALGATELLREILGYLERGDDGAVRTEAALGEVVDRLDERAFGLLLLLLALPCCLPFVYVLPQIVSLPMLALTGQLAAGRHSPWLPKALAERQFNISNFRSVLDRSAKYLGFVERIARPRLSFITGRRGAQVVGALLIIPAASIMVPLPGTNSVPGVGVSVASVGLIERDGLLVILGLLIGLLWVGALLIFGLEAASLIKDWIAARF